MNQGLLTLAVSAVSFGVLLYTSHRVADAIGLNLSNLILLGLPKPDDPMSSYTLDDVLPLASNPAVIASVGLVVASIVYLLFLNGRTSCSTRFSISTSFSFLARKPVLKPNDWQEFPLVQKTKISPNTAM